MKQEAKKCDGNDKGKRGDITEEGGEIITVLLIGVLEFPLTFWILSQRTGNYYQNWTELVWKCC